MPTDILVNLLTSLAELLRLSLIVSIPMLLCGTTIKSIAGFLSSRYAFSFARASFLATYVMVLALIIVLYFFPLYLGFAESPLTYQEKPPEFQFTLTDLLEAVPATAVKLLFTALVFTLLLLPLEFVAAYISDALKERFSLGGIPGMYAAVFLASVVLVAIALFIFPFTVTGLIYLLYFG